jgi:hypothetical protein
MGPFPTSLQLNRALPTQNTSKLKAGHHNLSSGTDQ